MQGTRLWTLGFALVAATVLAGCYHLDDEGGGEPTTTEMTESGTEPFPTFTNETGTTNTTATNTPTNTTATTNTTYPRH